MHMDPLSSIVIALAVGAAGEINPAVEQAVKNGYAALKALIRHRYAQVNVDLLEQDPSSASGRTMVKEDLAKSEAVEDEELLRQAQNLLETIERHTPEVSRAYGVDMDDIKAASLTIKGICDKRFPDGAGPTGSPGREAAEGPPRDHAKERLREFLDKRFPGGAGPTGGPGREPPEMPAEKGRGAEQGKGDAADRQGGDPK
jgi:hypothetical protein